MEFTTEALINCVQSENVIWDSMLNVDEEMTGTNQREAGSQLAFDRLLTGFRPVRTSFYPAFSQLSAGFRPARLMECGL